MRAIANTAPNTLELLDVPMPEPGPRQVRVRTAACGICATELEMVSGWDRTGFPAIPGHEWSGRIDAVGPGVDGSLAGVNCVAENVQSSGGEVGFEHPGGYGEYFVTEAANVRALPAGFAMDTAALIEPLAVCMHAIARLPEDIPEPVLVSGDGPIGILMCMLMIHRGKRTDLIGGSSRKINIAREIGVHRAIDYHDLPADVSSALVGGPYSTIIEASGSRMAMDLAMSSVSRKGTVLLVSDYGQNARADFRWLHLIHREIALIGSNASAGAWDDAVRIAVSGSLPLDRLITHRFPVTEFEDAFATLRNHGDQVVKAVLIWS